MPRDRFMVGATVLSSSEVLVGGRLYTMPFVVRFVLREAGEAPR